MSDKANLISGRVDSWLSFQKGGSAPTPANIKNVKEASGDIFQENCFWYLV